MVLINVDVLTLSGGISVIAAAGWLSRPRPRADAASAMETIDALDQSSRAVLRLVAEREPFRLGEIPGLSHAAAQEYLDRLSAMGILKCELTAGAGDGQGTTLWTVYPEFKQRALAEGGSGSES